jgi:hypothetical protein
VIIALHDTGQAPVYVCQTCGRIFGRIRPSCPYCPDGRVWVRPIRVDRLATLSHNFAIGAALCRAFDLGWDQCVDATTCCGSLGRCGHVSKPWWAPGCGKAAP